MNPEIERLVFKAYHGELCQAERELLSQWVAASPAHARQVLEYSIDANSIAMAVQDGGITQASNGESKPINLEQPPYSFWNSNFITFKQAALVVITYLVAVAIWLGLCHQMMDNHEQSELVASSPARSAGEVGGEIPVDWQIMESTNLEWNCYTSTQFNKDSDAIVIPASGFVYHEFNGGGFILLQGPASYQLEDAYTIRLIEGRLVAKADPLEPFAILVDSAEITGEGAEFGVEYIDNDVASAVAFEGLIKVDQSLSDVDSIATSVTAGQSVSLQSDGEVGQLEPASGLDMVEYKRLIDSVKLRPSYMAPTIQFLAQAPSSVRSGDLVNDRYCRLFCERAGVSVNAGDLPTIPQRLTDLEEVPTDVLLDSYVLHFDPQVGSSAMSTGKIIFDRPIRAVLGSAVSIQSTDAVFGSAITAYPRIDRLGSSQDTQGWGIEFDEDCIKLGEDSKTLYFRFRSNQELDQIRILVEARNPPPFPDS